MKRQGWRPADMARDELVYQLSLRLGVSYMATCHGLQRNEVIDRDQCERLVSVPPKTIKKRILGAHAPDD
jgi:hypothetical protein